MGNFNRVDLPTELAGILVDLAVVDIQYEEINGTGEVRLFVGGSASGYGFLRVGSDKARLIAAAVVDAADRADFEVWRQAYMLSMGVVPEWGDGAFLEWRTARDGGAFDPLDMREETGQ